jgi:hypothetical protein
MFDSLTSRKLRLSVNILLKRNLPEFIILVDSRKLLSSSVVLKKCSITCSIKLILWQIHLPNTEKLFWCLFAPEYVGVCVLEHTFQRVVGAGTGV